MTRKRKFTYAYPRPALTVDVVLFAPKGKGLEVLLIQRDQEPFAGAWALPGGFVDEGESLRAAAWRELREETGLGRVRLVQVGTFGDPNRDPRGWVVTVAFAAHIRREKVHPKAADDARAVDWFPLRRLPPLAFDHRKIIATARKAISRH